MKENNKKEIERRRKREIYIYLIGPKSREGGRLPEILTGSRKPSERVFFLFFGAKNFEV